jgi:hypothetical protein
MKLSRRIALGGQQLDEVDASVVIRSIDTGTPRETVQTAAMMGGSGQRVTMRHWDTIDVSVSYAIDIPKKQLAERRAVFDAVKAWALARGWLTVNYMSGKRLYVDSVTLPTGADLWRWTDEYTITFRAYSVPFWQDETAVTGSNGRIEVPGDVETVCNAELTNGSGSTVNSLTVQVSDSVFEFSGLGLGSGETLKIGHTDNGILYIRIYSGASTWRSVLDKRTGGSSDDLTVKPGSKIITVSGSGVSGSISCYGRYL